MSIMNPVATGIFFDSESLVKYRNVIDSMNFPRLEEEQQVIFAGVNRHPGLSDIHEEWIGKDVMVQVIGYGRDQYFEAFRCQIYPTGDKTFDEFLKVKGAVPSIIISKSNRRVQGANVDNVVFWGLGMPFFLHGKYGVLTKKGEVSIGTNEKEEEK